MPLEIGYVMSPDGQAFRGSGTELLYLELLDQCLIKEYWICPLFLNNLDEYAPLLKRVNSPDLEVDEARSLL